MSSEHVLVLGATGVSGVVFIRYVLSLPDLSRPRLTLYVRNPSKLPEEVKSNREIRIVHGALTDSKALEDAMSENVTVVVSFLGAYLSFQNFILHRTGPTPISDAMPTIFDAMRAKGIKRVFTLSTFSGILQLEESSNLPRSWYLKGIIMPKLVVPQGDAEMRGIAVHTMGQEDLDWTVYRVPHLNNGDPNSKVIAQMITREHQGSTELSRGSLAMWILQEIKERKWIKGIPYLSNP